MGELRGKNELSHFERILHKPLFPEDQIQDVEAIHALYVHSFQNSLSFKLPQDPQIAAKKSGPFTRLVNQECDHSLKPLKLLL